MDSKAMKMAMGKKINTIAVNENKSVEEVKKIFCSCGTEEEQYKKLVSYVDEHKYKGKRISKTNIVKDNTKNLKIINLEVHSINQIINSVASDADKLQRIKEIIEKVMTNNEIVRLKEEIENKEKQLEEDKRILQDKIKSLG